MKAIFLIMPTAIIFAASIVIQAICPNRIYLSGIAVFFISSIFTLLFLSFCTFCRKNFQTLGKSGTAYLKTYNFFFGYYFGISILGVWATAFFLSCSHYNQLGQIF